MADKKVDWFAESNKYAMLLAEQQLKAKVKHGTGREMRFTGGDAPVIANGAILADRVEVVHGYWIDSTSVDHVGRIIEHSIDCSVCDSVFKDDSRAVVKHWKERFKVCPFCGAVMDGDGNG